MSFITVPDWKTCPLFRVSIIGVHLNINVLIQVYSGDVSQLVESCLRRSVEQRASVRFINTQCLPLFILSLSLSLNLSLSVSWWRALPSSRSYLPMNQVPAENLNRVTTKTEHQVQCISNLLWLNSVPGILLQAVETCPLVTVKERIPVSEIEISILEKKLHFNSLSSMHRTFHLV